MGNRAVITTQNNNPNSTGIYLHWNGGVESVLAFLEAAKKLDVRSPVADGTYSFARLAQIIGNWFGGTTSIGIGSISQLDTDNGDNGTYEVNDKWEIVNRTHSRNAVKSVEAPDKDGRERYDSILAEVLAVNEPIFKKAA